MRLNTIEIKRKRLEGTKIEGGCYNEANECLALRKNDVNITCDSGSIFIFTSFFLSSPYFRSSRNKVK